MAASESPDKPFRRMVSYRSAHRARSHESAHAEDSGQKHGRQIDHPLVPDGAAPLVDEQPALLEVVAHLRASGRFAYDSEFIGELTYVPKLCLLQVASAERVALIDPLADLDLRPFWELLADPSVEKIVHAGQQDLEPVPRLIDRSPANVFDTQISAGFIGLPYPVSLSKLVHELVGVKLGKGLTFTHWDQRPLSAMQLRYAADDVRYLPLLRQRIGERLDALGHAEWAAEECAAQADPNALRLDPEMQYQRVRGSGNLAPRNLAILRELATWRDAVARLGDVPPRAFLKDEILIDLSRNPIRSFDKLARVRGLPRPVETEYGGQIVEITAKALALPESELPPQRESEQTPAEKFRTDSLWSVAQCICAGQGIDIGVAANRQEIHEFHQHLAGKEHPPHRLFTGWRRAALGEPLSRLVRGAGRVELKWLDDSLQLRASSSPSNDPPDE